MCCRRCRSTTRCDRNGKRLAEPTGLCSYRSTCQKQEIAATRGASAHQRSESGCAEEAHRSDTADDSYQELPSADTMKALGLEPRTYGLKGYGHRTEVSKKQSLTGGADRACTNACTESSDSGRSRTVEATDTTAPGAAAGDHFAAAVAMLNRLPLTDAERAEAVRRLMAGQSGATGDH
jgi:hypothetical protein